MNEIHKDYTFVMDLLERGSPQELAEVEQLTNDFPMGKDQFIGRHWITNAIDCGSLETVKWMLSRKVNLHFLDEEGYTVLHSSIDRAGPNKYEILELLLTHGADVNAKGINDWTPAHMGAARNDVDALRLLVKYGANLSIRTKIDSFTTPLEEAQNLGCIAAADFLKSLKQ